MAMNQRTRAASESIGFLGIIAGILVVLNVLGFFAFKRFDFTEKELFSLSDGSKRLASRLTDRMTIRAYFTADLPPPFNATERYVRDILTEYRDASNGKIVLEFINPDTDELKEQAETDGIRRVEHRAFENDGIVVREGFRGIVMRYLDKTETIPVIEDTAGIEYTITMALKKMLGDRKRVGILSGHEGPTLEAGLSGLRDSLPTYDLVEVSATEEIDDDLAALLVIGPATALSDTELRRIDQYVMQGGSVGFFITSHKINIEEQQQAPPAATPAETGLNPMLRAWGVELRSGMVADAQCGQAPLQTQFGLQIPVPHPPVPIISFTDDQQEHPALFRIDSAPMFFMSPLRITDALDDDQQAHVEVLGRTSDDSWILSGDSISIMPRSPDEWHPSGEAGPFPVIVAITGKLPSAFAGISSEGEGQIEAPERATEDARVLVVGSSFLLRDEAMPPPDRNGERQVNSSLALALNSIDWLAQDEDLVEIRAKNIEDPPIEVPRNVKQAEEDAQSAEESAQTAEMEAIKAAQGRDREGMEKNKAAMEKAAEDRDEALERRKAALEAWENKKDVYRWGNMLGIPFLFALFGVARWQLRKTAKKNVKL